MHENQRATKEPLAGIAGGYGHPVHAALVAVPIGAWVAAVLFDLGAVLTGRPYLSEGAFWLIGIGLVGAAAAAAFGFLDYLTLPAGTLARRVGTWHLALMLAATALFSASLFFRLPLQDTASTPSFVAVALSLVGIALVVIGGWFGGHLSYKFGVRVADEQTQATAFQPTPN